MVKPLRRTLTPLPVLAALLAMPAASASAQLPAPALGGVDVEVPEAVVRTCHAGLLPAGASGARTTPYIATQDGALTGELAGTNGDWDLAAYDTVTGRKLAAAATAGSRESITALARQGQSVSFQACRRSGASDAARLTIRLTPVDLTPTPDARPTQLVAVDIDGPVGAARLAERGFDVTHGITETTAEVVLPTAADGQRLRDLGYSFTVKEPDLSALYRAAAAEDAAAALRPQQRALPSGRTTYRRFEDYGQDLKNLIAANKGHTRAFTLGKSLDGVPIEGVEIAADVGRVGDGRPIFFLGGVTHAREWPSGDTAMEFAIELATKFRLGTDARITALLAKTRVVVVPLQNPDGFIVSRQAGTAANQDGGDDSSRFVTLPLAANDAAAYKRKNCRAATPEAMAMPCALRGPNGVDLNRAYGAFWGGEGSDPAMNSQGYRGLAPFTEPEAQGIRRFGAANQIQTYITQHTHDPKGLWLRQPGFKAEGDEVPDVTQDEARMAKLGDAMAAATDYRSEVGYATLGSITGPADDFLYYSQGTFGYTPELRGANFHTSYADAVVKQYEGTGAQAGKGLREAYLLAGEQAGDPADHAVLKGSAPAGRVLRLKKTTTLRTTIVPEGDTDVFFDETLDTVLTVPSSGAYEWHVNPSTRPLLPARSEAFTMTCEMPDGTVLGTSSVTVDRGEVVTRDFACTPEAPTTPTETTTTPGTTPPTTSTDTTTPPTTSTETTTTATTPPTTTPPGTTVAAPTPSAIAAVKAAAARVSITILRPSFSARRTKRLGGLALYLRLRGGGLRDVRASIVDARGRVLLSGRRATQARSGRVALKRRATLRPRAVRVRVSARDARGRRVTATRSSRIVR